MKQLTIILLMFICSHAHAQNGLRINELFEGKIVPAEKMVETRIRGKAISKYKLSYFHSVRFQTDDALAKKIDRIATEDFTADSEKFTTREPYSSGTARMDHKKVKTFTQMYELAPRNNTRRYLCYKRVGDIMTVIYLEGSVASLDELKIIFKD